MWVSAKAVSVGSNEHWGKSSIETYTLPYVKQIASGCLLYDQSTQSQSPFDKIGGRDGEGGGMCTYG